MSNIEEIKKELQSEGYARVGVMTDPPGKFYPEHTHDQIIPHVIIEGEMLLTVSGIAHMLKTGDRFDVPAHDVHSARIGMEGCTYIIAERE